MVIGDVGNIVEAFNSNFISGLANMSQFYNIYQSTKAGTYAQLNHDLDRQTNAIESKLDTQTIEIIEKLINEINIVKKQNEELLNLLR